MAVSTRRTSGPVLRSHAPSGRFQNPSASYTTSFASTSSAFSARSSSFFQQRSPASPAPVSIYGTTSSSSVSFSFDNRSISPSRSISSLPRNHNQAVKKTPKRTCMCSPTTHPGSFRCSLHKNSNSTSNNSHNHTAPYPSNRLNARRSAMTNSLVRIGTVEGGDLVKRALAALIRPSSHQQKRRTSFQPRPSRLSVMSKA